MALQTVTAIFDTRTNAERAVDALRLGVSLEPGAIHIAPSDTPATASAVLVTATVEHDHTFKAIDILHRHGAAGIRHNEADIS